VLRYANPWQLSYPIIYGTGGADVANTARDVSNMDFDSAWRRVNDPNFRVGGLARGFQRGLESVGNSMRSGIRSVGRSLGYHWKDEPMTLGELETGARNPFAKNRLKAQPRLGLPAGKKAVPRIIAKLPMKRKYHTTGNYGGKFTGYTKKKTLPASYSGCVLKGERQGSLSDPNAVYVGHVTTPLYQTLRAIGWSIVRLLAKKWHQDFASFYGVVNGPDKTSSCSLRVTLSYRTTQLGIINDDTWTVGTSTWAELGDNIIHHILSNCTSSLLYFEVVRIKFANIDATAVESLQTVIFHGHNLKIAVSGHSNLKIQNNTVSNSGDTSANEQSDDVANNPLVGKQYFGKGYHHLFKFNDDYTTSAPALYYENNTGALFHAPGSLTSAEASLTNLMNKIPNHKAITGLKAYRNVKLAPGEIRSSKLKSFNSMSLNQWIRHLFVLLRGAPSLASLGGSGTSTFLPTKLGKNSIIGLEHMLHSGSEPDISVSYQLDWTVTGVATHKKKMFCNPAFDLATSTVIVSESPAVS